MPQIVRTRFVLSTLFFLAAACFAIPSLQAQHFTVIHNFTGGPDGGEPRAGLTLDQAGNLYGTTAAGGNGGTVFKLTLKNSHWVLNSLYNFAGGQDGGGPNARVIFGPDNALYGTTSQGGGSSNCSFGCGTVFRLSPFPTPCKSAICFWDETVLYRFTGGNDGGIPRAEVTFDQAGNLYSTTYEGGGSNRSCIGVTCGTVFKLSHSGGGWTQNVIYYFTGGNDGSNPYSGVIFDGTGNLYGTTEDGGSVNCEPPSGCGVAYQLRPNGPGWTENTLYVFGVDGFGTDGGLPRGGLFMDNHGTLYGSTVIGGQGGGTVFALAQSGGSWTYRLLAALSGAGGGPFASLTMDPSGNLYGTTSSDGANSVGSVFKLTPSGDSWIYSTLHDFGGQNDGSIPLGGVVRDSSGSLYGTTTFGGQYGEGVIWEITP
jgi:uncharacterized repeat protein (TIGR03803 family)